MKRVKKNIKKTIKKRIELTNRELNNKQPRQNNNIVLNKNRVGLPKPKNEKGNLKTVEQIRKGESYVDERLKKRIGKQKKINKKVYNDNNITSNFFNKKYIKRNYVDYDCIIIISSYERYNKLYSILNQLYTQKTDYIFKTIIINDGSNDKRYKSLVNLFNNIDYLENDINNGKRMYWKTINKLFKKASEYKSHAVIQIDDDFILCDNFINKLMDLFFKVKEENNKYVAIYYHNVGIKLEAKRWGLSQWLDGGSLFDTYFLEKIKYKIDNISNRRWIRSFNASSGVWMQVSSKINKNECLVYQPELSYALHNGNDKSMMNSELRKIKPIETKYFISNE
jgi:hypothetical protein